MKLIKSIIKIILFCLVCMIFIVTCKNDNKYIIQVPGDFDTIQEAINYSKNGNTIVISKGVYFENLVVNNKNITIKSKYKKSNSYNDNYVKDTVIDGNGGTVFEIVNTEQNKVKILGLTIRNGDDGIRLYSKIIIQDNIIKECGDGIDYEAGSGGICENNIIELNSDDGIDFDYDVDVLVDNNIIRNNGDDGIEIRLHDYEGEKLTYKIYNNYFYKNLEDGIQIVDYDGKSDRFIDIRYNFFIENSMSAIGCMSNGNTIEDYEGAMVEELIFIANNTFFGNNYGLTGGANVLFVNNLIMNTAQIALKNVNNLSIVVYSSLYNNSINFENTIVGFSSIIYSDPEINNTKFSLYSNSPCIDNGINSYDFNGILFDVQDSKYDGNAPDIGAFEYVQ